MNKMEWKIPLFKTYTDESDVDAVSKIIRRGSYWADGEEIREFEKKISNYIFLEMYTNTYHFCSISGFNTGYCIFNNNTILRFYT